MPAVVGEVISCLISGTDHVRMGVQQDGCLHFSGMHIAVRRGLQTGSCPGRSPVTRAREKSHPQTAGGGGFLNNIAQHVISAVPVHQNQRGDTGAVEGVGDITDHGVKRRGGNTDRTRPGGMLVGAGHRHGRKVENRMRGGDLGGDRAGDDRVGHQGEKCSVLLEAADGKHGNVGPAGPYVLRGVRREQARSPLWCSRTAHVVPAFRTSLQGIWPVERDEPGTRLMRRLSFSPTPPWNYHLPG